MVRKGRYEARLAQNAGDVAAAQALRYRSFVAAHAEGRDADRFDECCDHVLIEETASGRLVCCYRVLRLRDAAEIGQSYAAQFYDVSALTRYSGRMAEVGRFCIDTDFAQDPDILRVAWGALTHLVDETGIDLLFGCSSFQGTETESYLDAFAMLKERHLAPKRWLPKVKAPKVFRFANRLRRRPDLRAAMRTMPPLLRSYLMMGGWVSDHAVVDHDLNTLHVFTGLEIATVPPARAKALRLVAG